MDKDKRINILLIFCIISVYFIALILNAVKENIHPAVSIIIFTISISITGVVTFIVSSNSINKREKRTRK
jgi:phosphate starvation-inducible membrane PsiE